MKKYFSSNFFSTIWNFYILSIYHTNETFGGLSRLPSKKLLLFSEFWTERIPTWWNLLISKIEPCEISALGNHVPPHTPPSCTPPYPPPYPPIIPPDRTSDTGFARFRSTSMKKKSGGELFPKVYVNAQLTVRLQFWTLLPIFQLNSFCIFFDGTVPLDLRRSWRKSQFLPSSHKKLRVAVNFFLKYS